MWKEVLIINLIMRPKFKSRGYAKVLIAHAQKQKHKDRFQKNNSRTCLVMRWQKSMRPRLGATNLISHEREWNNAILNFIVIPHIIKRPRLGEHWWSRGNKTDCSPWDQSLSAHWTMNSFIFAKGSPQSVFDIRWYSIWAENRDWISQQSAKK